MAGKDSFVADALSRIINNVDTDSQLAIDYAAMAAAQLTDPEIATCMHLHTVSFGAAQTKLVCDVSTGRPRRLVPTSFYQPIFDAAIHLINSDLDDFQVRVARHRVAG